jgi:hypothetical protein
MARSVNTVLYEAAHFMKYLHCLIYLFNQFLFVISYITSVALMFSESS